MTITLTGQTFQHRDRLKQLGGKWNADGRNWQFDFLRPSEIAELKNLAGCLVTDNAPTPPAPRETDSDDNDDIWSRIMRGTADDKPSTGNRPSVMYGDDMRYHNYFKDKNPRSFFGFSSLSALLQFIDAIPQHKRTGQRGEGYDRSKPDWYGTPDMLTALDLARNGWPQGIANAQQVLETLDIEHVLQRRRSYAVAGGSVSVGRMLAGNPVHMVKRPKLPGRRVVTLFVENMASAYMKAETLTVRAAIVAALADILETNGYSCEIVNVTVSNFMSGKPAAHTTVVLKHAGEKLNIADLAFALGHPSFLRRFVFALVCQADELESMWDYQGMPTSAFGGDCQPGRSEFYIKRLSENISGGTLVEKARKMLPLVKPDNLPVEIN
ncbi:hypothetical protein [Rhizobium phage RHph_X2_24]|nr:hypothetical protein [Rhizobium phage RHph_X2_24]